MNDYLNGMKQYFTFRGRATRSEFWMFMLVTILLGFGALTVDTVLNENPADPPVLTALVMIAHYIPGLAVSVRRLHDINRSGWWVLLGLIPLGLIVLLIFWCQPSAASANQLEAAAAPVNVAQPPPTPAQNASQGQPATYIDQLEQLASLKLSGDITEAEYESVKSEILKELSSGAAKA